MNQKVNIFLITIDCLRADFFNLITFNESLTPNLSKFMREGIYFSETFANGPTTRNSFPSILSSTYTLMYPSFFKELSEYRVSIPKILKHHKYTTIGVNFNAFLSRFYNYNKGFDIYYDVLSRTPLSFEKIIRYFYFFIKKTFFKKILNYLTLKDRLHESAKKVNKIVLSTLRKCNQPFFVWIHYMDSHFPYYPPKKYRKYGVYETKMLNKIVKNNPSRVSDFNFKKIIDLYKGTLKYIDFELGKFFGKLKALGLYNNSLFIITADHGDEFKEHGDFSHTAKLYDELLHVPLIIRGPRIPKNKIVDHIVSLLDISPTILDYLQIAKNDEFKGFSLIPLFYDDISSYNRIGVISEVLVKEPFYRMVSYRTKEWKYIINEKTNKKELYHLIKDRNENNNIYNLNKDLAKKFEEKIKLHKDMELRMHKQINEMKSIKNVIKKIKFS
ncbi:MAG: sulfatase [Candidatus Hodarchaeota archaeon]